MKKFVVTSLALLIMALGTPVFAHSNGGHYAGGHGSSHKGGHYKNPKTHDHYQHHHR